MRLPLDRSRLPPDPASAEGLASSEVDARRRTFGENDILPAHTSSWKALAADTARDPMIWFMVAVSALYFVLGDRVEGWILLLATVPLVGMDAYLHRRAQRSLSGLSEGLAATAVAVRDGQARSIPARAVVVGDLLEVRAGESFPADGVLVLAEDAQAQEASLTGESFPVRKDALGPLPAEGRTLVEGRHWGLAGTRLLAGRVRLRVVQVGAGTLFGEIARSSEQTRHARTPLQEAVTHLVAALVVVAALFCAVLAWVRWWQGNGVVDALVSAATLAVAALPEEFPVALTFFLGVGVVRLARRHALVRRAVSIENVGRVTCICSDKTGTLTEGRLKVTALAPAEGVDEDALLQAAALASRPETGDPMDVALSERWGRPPGGTRRALFPFTEERRRETAVWEEGGALRAVVKGAPERVLAACAPTDADFSRRWLERVHALAAEGTKVLACAERALGADWPGGEPSRDLRLLGLLALEDPLRPGVPEAIARCRRAGVRTVILTGDHPVTAKAVAARLGLGGPEGPRVVQGEAVDADAPLLDADVVARALPAQKLTFVRALQAQGEVVAVTGDGVNDVPALQAADVGIAMGERGTRPAKDAAAIVLLDDDFLSIVGAIAEGRQLFLNLRSAFAYLLLVHIPLVFTAAIIPLAGFPLLYLPIHVVWLELIIHPTAMLAFQVHPPKDRIPPLARGGKVRFFAGLDWLALGASGVLSVVVVVWGYQHSLGATQDVPHARAMAMAYLVVASSLFTAILSRLSTRSARWVAGLSLLASVLLIQLPSAGPLSISPLHWDDWAFALLAAVIATGPLWLRGLLSVSRGRSPPARSPRRASAAARRRLSAPAARPRTGPA